MGVTFSLWNEINNDLSNFWAILLEHFNHIINIMRSKDTLTIRNFKSYIIQIIYKSLTENNLIDENNDQDMFSLEEVLPTLKVIIKGLTWESYKSMTSKQKRTWLFATIEITQSNSSFWTADDQPNRLKYIKSSPLFH